MIFCILDRGMQRVIKSFGAENGVESRVLRLVGMEKWGRYIEVVCIQIILLLRIKRKMYMGLSYEV